MHNVHPIHHRAYTDLHAAPAAAAVERVRRKIFQPRSLDALVVVLVVEAADLERLLQYLQPLRG